MKKEDIVIEVDKNLVNDLMRISTFNGFDFNHIPFKEFSMKESLGKSNDIKSMVEKTLKEYKHMVQHLSEAKIENLIESFSQDMEKGMITKVSIKDKEINIAGDFDEFKVVFNDYAVPNNWMKDCSFQIYLKNENKNSTVRNHENYYEAILMLLGKVVGLLSYLQMPNKEKSISKRTNLQVKTSKKKGKSSKNTKKTYLYKTTYKIDKLDMEDINIDSEFDFSNISRNYTRKTDEWKQRGHWRHYKSGKKVWINETTKKSKTPINSTDEDNSKHYKISRLDL